MRKTYKAWLNERSEEGIADLPDGFLKECSDHMAQLRLGYNLLEKGSLRHRLATKELELLSYMLRDLLAIRQRKVLNMKPGQREEGFQMLAEDRDVLQKFLEASEARDRLLERTIHGKIEAKKTEHEKRAFAVVRILKDTPAFVSVDGVEIGPYRAGDVVSMPAPNARILVRQSYAKAIDFARGEGEDAD
ncbi:MAG: hypothetical protein JTT11_02370 [Candidatus Brockarchaeota archaeon]|nr:hypothetical protein [Candidatus Brockarchaeota archaeon]